jgi:hypothetical protein
VDRTRAPTRTAGRTRTRCREVLQRAAYPDSSDIIHARHSRQTSCPARRILVAFCSAPGSACAPAKWDSVIPQQLRVEPGAAPLLKFNPNVNEMRCDVF